MRTVKEPKRLEMVSLAAKAKAKPPIPRPAMMLFIFTEKLLPIKIRPMSTTRTLRVFLAMGTSTSSNLLSVLAAIFSK